MTSLAGLNEQQLKDLTVQMNAYAEAINESMRYEALGDIPTALALTIEAIALCPVAHCNHMNMLRMRREHLERAVPKPKRPPFWQRLFHWGVPR